MSNSKPIGVAYEDQKLVNPEFGGTVSVATSLRIGSASTDLIGFYGTAGTDQAAAITSLSTTVWTYTTTPTTVVGFDSTAQFIAAISAINSLILMAREKGLLAS